MNDYFKESIKNKLINQGIVDGEIINLNKLVDIVSEIVTKSTTVYVKPSESDIKKELEKQLKAANHVISL